MFTQIRLILALAASVLAGCASQTPDAGVRRGIRPAPNPPGQGLLRPGRACSRSRHLCASRRGARWWRTVLRPRRASSPGPCDCDAVRRLLAAMPWVCQRLGCQLHRVEHVVDPRRPRSSGARGPQRRPPTRGCVSCEIRPRPHSGRRERQIGDEIANAGCGGGERSLVGHLPPSGPAPKTKTPKEPKPTRGARAISAPLRGSRQPRPWLGSPAHLP